MSAARVAVLPWRELDGDDRRAWTEHRARRPELRSPYFDLGWFDAVDQARGDLRVLRWTDDDGPAAFLAFHPTVLGARPAGGVFSDWHGVVARPGFSPDLRRAASAVNGFRFRTTPPNDPALAPWAAPAASSLLMDLSAGFDAYARPEHGPAPAAVRHWRRNERKLDADGRSRRFVLDDRSPEAFETTLRLKSDQFRRTGQSDVISHRWSRALMTGLFEDRREGFGGLLSTFWIDDQLAAAHFGLRSESVLHYWQPTYAPSLAQYSPGMLMMQALAREAAAAGVTEIDLGPGDYQHKRHLANREACAVAGVVHAHSPAGRASALAAAAGRRWAALPVGPAARLPARASRRLEHMVAGLAPPP